MLRGIEFLSYATDVVLSHHERFDGTGYPKRLSGSDIPLHARIFAVVDALDAMTSERPYRPALLVRRGAPGPRRPGGNAIRSGNPGNFPACTRVDLVDPGPDASNSLTGAGPVFLSGGESWMH